MVTVLEKKKCIVADNLLNQIVLLVAIVVSMIINRRHCFWSIRHRKKTKKKLVNDRSYLETIWNIELEQQNLNLEKSYFTLEVHYH